MQEEQKYEAYEVPYAQKRDPSQNDKSLDFNCYEVKDILGSGSFGKVAKVLRIFKETEDGPILKWPYACKIIRKDNLQKLNYPGEDEDGLPCFLSGMDVLKREVNIYRYLDCKNICKLFEIIYDEDEIGDFPNYIFLILQLCDLGELMDWDGEKLQFIRNKKIDNFIRQNYNIGVNKYGYSKQTLGPQSDQYVGIQLQSKEKIIENTAKVIFQQILKGLKYMHDNNIVHRDIKPQNIFCKSFDEASGEHIKIGDFTTARKFEDKEEMICESIGTPGIRSPEQFSGEDYNPFYTDIWCVGISLYGYISQVLPWKIDKESDEPIDEQWDLASQQQEIQFDQDLFSQDLQDFIRKCCEKKPENRITIDQALQHVWITGKKQQ